MKVYLHSEQAEKSPKYTVTVSPAADTKFVVGITPSEWKHPSGEPKQMEVDFEYGAAEVSQELGRYMVKRGIAHNTRLIRRIGQGITKLFGHDGAPLDAFDEQGRPIFIGGIQTNEAV